MSQSPTPPSFWKTARLLLRASRKRSTGRRTRQQELLNTRTRKGSTTDWGGFYFFFATLFTVFIHGMAVAAIVTAVKTAERIEVERQGKIPVSREFLDAAWTATREVLPADPSEGPIPHEIHIVRRQHVDLDPAEYASETDKIVERSGGSRVAVEQRLRKAVEVDYDRDLILDSEAVPGLRAVATVGPLPALAGSTLLILWGMMLVFQGEGLELDMQRRRFPIWEWLLSHPVPPGAVFLAEMLSPIAANPMYWSAPLFAGVLYGLVYGPLLGILACVVIGIPATVAAACLGKAFEILVLLRFSPRSRGAMVGLMGWLGYATTMVFLLGFAIIPAVMRAIPKLLEGVAVLPWPWLRLFLGGQPDGSFSFPLGMLACWIVAAATTVGSVWLSVWSTERGLSGSFGMANSGPTAPRRGEKRFGKDPLYRKEFLWFIRDRSAIVQTILIPLTVAGAQAFNLRGILGNAQGAWNYLCATGIIFGTYFLWVLGPKSLASEGAALWIALTWPRGLESLLKAKAWLWSMISSGLVALVLCYAAFVFPTQIWKIGLVGIGWFFFGRSMAEKSVTLVTITSESGEVQKTPSGRRWASMLGMLTFSIGVLTQQWHIAIMGIVYSWITAAAMWQNFRARLPYLYDPWSEELPPPPTLMHAMISISILVESGAVVTAGMLGLMGRANIAIAQAMSYAVCAVAVSIGVSLFLSNRDVSGKDIWHWETAPGTDEEPLSWWRRTLLDRRFGLHLLAGAGIGLILGLFGRGYLAALEHLPLTAQMVNKAREQMDAIPYWRISYAVMAVLFAPFAEEYLFRGLLFRALDREWGGWRAVIGAAAFFAIYHPAISWPPVFLLGAANCLLFRKTRRLAPAVLLHMVYNAVVLS